MYLSWYFYYRAQREYNHIIINLGLLLQNLLLICFNLAEVMFVSRRLNVYNIIVIIIRCSCQRFECHPVGEQLYDILFHCPTSFR